MMGECRICGEEMTQDGVVHPRLDCNGACMACCATMAEFPYHIGQLIAWYHRGNMMDRLNKIMFTVGECIAANKAAARHAITFAEASQLINRNSQLSSIYFKLSYYWEQFSNDKTI